jgi:outer membrane protein TolC
MKTYIKLVTWILIFSPGYLFAQPRDLNFYIEKAKANSVFIHKSQNEKRIVQLDLDQLKSIYSRPEVTVDASVLFAPIILHQNNTNRFKLVSEEDGSDYSGYALPATDGGQYQALLSIRQGLFNGTKLQKYAEKTDVQMRISDNNIELSVHELENAVKHQYLLCLKAEKQSANNLELVKVVEDELQTMQKLAENAIYKKSDLMLLEITRQNYLQEYETSLADYKNALYDLNLLCGIEDSSDVKIEDVTFRQNPEIISESKFLATFYLDSLALATDLKLSELKYKPQINLFANTGLNAVYVPTLNRFGFSTGVTFSLLLADGNQRGIERRKMEINQQTLGFEKQKTEQQNIIQRHFTQSQITSLDKRISLARKQLDDYNKLLEIYKTQLGQGEISVMDYKYLLKDISEKKQEKLLLEMEKQIVINAYNY